MKGPRYSHHRHTGRRLPHAHTSYALLTFLLLIAGVLLLGIQERVRADVSISVTATVLGPPPIQGAVITSPKAGTHFTKTQVTVSGTCQANLPVKIFRNGALAGSTSCTAGGTFSLLIDLFPGRDDLTAHDYDFLNQPGPDSPMVTVYYDAPTPVAGGVNQGKGANIPYIISDYGYQAVTPGGVVQWPVQVVGGAAPYAVLWDWGDGHQDLISRTAVGFFTVQHLYERAGYYVVKIKVTDTLGLSSSTQLFSLIQGGGAKVTAPSPETFNLLWPILLLLFFVVSIFWLGERHEKHVIGKQLGRAL